jgi:hypothetical protein
MLRNVLLDPRRRYSSRLCWLQLKQGGEYRPQPFEGVRIAG